MEKICPDCNGSGLCGCITLSPDGEDYFDLCPTCSGEGEIEMEVQNMVKKICALKQRCVGCPGECEGWIREE